MQTIKYFFNDLNDSVTFTSESNVVLYGGNDAIVCLGISQLADVLKNHKIYHMIEFIHKHFAELIKYKELFDMIAGYVMQLVNINIAKWKQIAALTNGYYSYFHNPNYLKIALIKIVCNSKLSTSHYFSHRFKTIKMQDNDEIKEYYTESLPFTITYESTIPYIYIYGKLLEMNKQLATEFICRCLISTDISHIILHNISTVEVNIRTKICLTYANYLMQFNEFSKSKDRIGVSKFTLDECNALARFNCLDLGQNPFVLFHMIENKQLYKYMIGYVQKERTVIDQKEFNKRLYTYRNINLLLECKNITYITGSFIIDLILNRKGNYISNLIDEDRLDIKYKDILSNFDKVSELYDKCMKTIDDKNDKLLDYIAKNKDEMLQQQPAQPIPQTDIKDIADDKSIISILDIIELLKDNSNELVELCEQLLKYSDVDICIQASTAEEFKKIALDIRDELTLHVDKEKGEFVYMIPKLSATNMPHYYIVSNILPFHLELFYTTRSINSFIKRFHFPITRVYFNTKLGMTYMFHSALRAYLTGINYELNVSHLLSDEHLFINAYKYLRRGFTTLMPISRIYSYRDWIYGKYDIDLNQYPARILDDHELFGKHDSNDNTHYDLYYTTCESFKDKYGICPLTSNSISVPKLSLINTLEI